MSDFLTYLRQNTKSRQYRKVSLQSQQRQLGYAKKMKKRKHPKKHRKINIQIVKNSFLEGKISKQRYDSKSKSPQKQEMVVVIPYDEFQGLMDITQKIKRSKTSLKRKLTFIKMAQQPTRCKFPAINSQKLGSLDKSKTNPNVSSQNNESIYSKARRETQKKLKKVRTQTQNYTQSTQNQISKQQFNEYLANIKQKLLQTSFHIQNNPSI